MEQCWRTVGRSFMYRENRSGPRIEPWGTPNLSYHILRIVHYNRPFVSCWRGSFACAAKHWHHLQSHKKIIYQVVFGD